MTQVWPDLPMTSDENPELDEFRVEPLEFDDFVQAQMPRLLAYATALAGDPNLAADVVQNVLVRTHAKWSTIRRCDNVERYVKRMVTNEYLSWRRLWHVRHVLPASAAVLHARAPAMDDPAQGVADRDYLRQRLATLPRRQRAVLVLRYFEGMDDAQIADVLGIAPSTVRSVASRALTQLRADTMTTKESR